MKTPAKLAEIRAAKRDLEQMGEPERDPYLLWVDPGSLTPTQERRIRLLAMLAEAEALTAQAGRLLHPRRCILLQLRDHRRAQRLVRRADALLVEIARLTGEQHTPLQGLPPHPLRRRGLWRGLQAVVGVYNLLMLFIDLDRGAYWLAGVSFLCFLVTLCWRVESIPA